MIIKSFEEVKRIVSEHPKASGVGYVITPQLLKIALRIGLVGYEKAFERWIKSGVEHEVVFPNYPPDEGTKTDGVSGEDIKFAVVWEGVGIRMYGEDMLVLGLQKLMEDIEFSLKDIEPEPGESKNEVNS